MKLNAEETALVQAHRKERAKQIKPSRTLASYSDQDRIIKFALFYEMAEEEFQHIVEHGRSGKDVEHWMYEKVMELLGKDIWDKTNPLVQG